MLPELFREPLEGSNLTHLLPPPILLLWWYMGCADDLSPRVDQEQRENLSMARLYWVFKPKRADSMLHYLHTEGVNQGMSQ